MAFFDNFFKIKTYPDIDTNFQFNEKTNSFNQDEISNLSSVYTSVKILSDTISRLPVHIYNNGDNGKIKDKQHYLYDKLHYNVNPYTNSQTFFSTLELHRNLKGNGFAYIKRNKNTGEVIQLEIINPDTFYTYDIIDNELYYIFYLDSKKKAYNSNDILHFKMLSKDGIVGINPIEALRLNISSSHKALSTIDNFYENNATTSKALKSTISNANQKEMGRALEKFEKSNAGSRNAGKIIPLPPNTELQELRLNLADAEFISTIKYNSSQIASLYGIPPHLVGNYEASKFNNVEQMQLNFKVNTISAIARMYRQEMELKLLTESERKEGKSIEFTLHGLVETDHKTRIEGYRTLTNIGAISPNTIAKLEGYETFPGGDKHYIQSNLQAIEDMDNNEK
ncbi:MAG: phage portal protein [bacterium]